MFRRDANRVDRKVFISEIAIVLVSALEKCRAVAYRRYRGRWNHDEWLARWRLNDSLITTAMVSIGFKRKTTRLNNGVGREGLQ